MRLNSHPAPEFPAEVGTPVIQATCSREGRSDLSHAYGHTHGEHAANQPDQYSATGTKGVEGSGEGGDTAS